MRERKRDTWIASIGWGCDRAGLRGGGFVGVFGPFLSGVWALVLVCYFFFLGLSLCPVYLTHLNHNVSDILLH